MGFLQFIIATTFFGGLVSGQSSLIIPQDGWTYELKSWMGYCLVVRDWSNADNAVVEMSVCEGDIALWTVKTIANYPGKYNLVNKYTGKCLTSGVNEEGTADGTPVLQYTCSADGSYAQLWWADQDIVYDEWPVSSAVRGNGDQCLTWENWWKGTLYLLECDLESAENQRVRFIASSGPTTSD